ncbi:MAG TPA: FAD-dependent oxidoreductase [Thermoanaerobaculia bacterium]|nr:FAD-dependent oxidoreductase [Thermoanaerobaculia bacterium]
MRDRVGNNVVIVGGGLTGLAASIYLARGGRTVTVFEKRRFLGGRAVTHLRHGFRFNLGAHALFRTGAAAAVYRELGIPAPGKLAKPKPPLAIFDGEEYRLPSGLFSLLFTSLLSFAGKKELARAILRVRKLDPAAVASMTVGQWLDANFTDARARRVMAALVRLSTYSAHETQSAALALEQVKIGLRGVIYIDEGWQRLVDSMRNTAVTSGVNFISSSRIVGIVRDHTAVRAVELGGLELDNDRRDTLSVALPDEKPEKVEGALIPAETVLLAIDPETAAELAGFADFTKPWLAVHPVTAACLDVGLRSLPNPKKTFALGIDDPLYYSVHSAFAQLAPKGGALIHLLKYRREQTATNEEFDGERPRRGGAGDDERELEALLDRMQPGWRDVLVHRRFLPAMTVANALPTPELPRPPVQTPVRGLYIAGDWVGGEGLLSDASLASARTAARAILATSQ